MSITDKAIVVTRAPHQAATLAEMLRDKGAVPLLYPCIDIAPPPDCNPLDAALRNLDSYEWVLFTSANTVLAVRRRLDALQVVPDWSRIKAGAVGPATAEAAETYLGMDIDTIPDEYTGEALGNQLGVQEDARVFVPQSEIATPDLVDALKEAGAHVNAVTAYKNIVGYGGENLPDLLARDEVDALTFTSGSTVRNFIVRLNETDTDVPFDVPAACIGPRTEEAATEAGFTHTITPDSFMLEPMVNALEAHFSGDS
jgi:uroporphyrinogen-III synthase